jgi:hypothetical protein
LGGGPYIAYGVSEALTVNAPANSMPFYSTSHHYGYRNPDYGINFTTGIEVKNHWTIDAGYGIGLQNLQSPGSIRNYLVSISVGYLFK